MAIASYFASAFRYKELQNVNDVNMIIAQFESEAVGNGNWTKPSAGVFKSPPDAMERWYQLQLSATSGSRLSIGMTDMFGNTIATREIDLDAGGNNVQLFTGPQHSFFRSARSTPEFAGAALVDLAPSNVLLPLYSLVGCGPRRVTDGGWDHNYMGEWFMWDGTHAVCDWREHAYNVGNNVWFTARPALSISGANVYYPVRIRTTAFDKMCWVGRLPQCILGPSTLADGSEVTVPIGDAGETGVFKEVSRDSSLSWLKLLVRKA